MSPATQPNLRGDVVCSRFNPLDVRFCYIGGFLDRLHPDVIINDAVIQKKGNDHISAGAIVHFNGITVAQDHFSDISLPIL